MQRTLLLVVAVCCCFLSASCGGGGGSGRGSGKEPGGGPSEPLFIIDSFGPSTDSVCVQGQRVPFHVDAESFAGAQKITVGWTVDGGDWASDAPQIEMDTGSLAAGSHLVEAKVSAGAPGLATSTLLAWRLKVLAPDGSPGGFKALFANDVPPTLKSVSPPADAAVEEGKVLRFMAVAADADAWDRLEYKWLVDTREVGEDGPFFDFRSVDFGPGLHAVQLLVFDVHGNPSNQGVPEEVGSSSSPSSSNATSYRWSVDVVAAGGGVQSGFLSIVKPLASPLIRAGSILPFQAVATEADSAQFRWEIDGNPVPNEEGPFFLYEPNENDVGMHSISVEMVGATPGAPRNERDGSNREAPGSGKSFTWVAEVMRPKRSSADFPPDATADPTPSPNAIVIDTTQTAARAEGKWTPSSANGSYGPNSLYGMNGASFTFEAESLVPGDYAIFLWWTYLESRSSQVPVDIRHAGGVAHLRVNQLRNGGRWNYLGTYSLARKTSVTLTAEGPLSTCADAVAFDPVGANLGAISQVILDNGDPGTRQEGVWKTSSGLLPFGEDSLYATGSGTYTYLPKLLPGRYRVYLWWTAFSSRSTRVPITIQAKSRAITIGVNQRTNGGQWNLIGSFDLDASSKVQLRVTDSSSVCADAVKFELVASPSSLPPDPAPSAPRGLLASFQDEEEIVNLDWSDNTEPDLSSYSVYRSTSPGGGYKLIASGIGGSRYTDLDVDSEATYYYVVTANDTSGNESAYSNEASPRLRGSATLTWDPVTTNADGSSIADLGGYRIYYGHQSRKYSVTVDVGLRTQYKISSLEPGNYYFAVKAFDTSGNGSKFSAEVKKTIP